MAVSDLTKCALHAYESEYIAFGSPTLHEEMMPRIESAIHYLRGLCLLKQRKVYVFGSFCWADKAVNKMKLACEVGNCEVIG